MDKLYVPELLSQSNEQNDEINKQLQEEIVELCEPIFVIEQMEIQPQIELDQAQFGFNNCQETSQLEGM